MTAKPVQNQIQKIDTYFKKKIIHSHIKWVVIITMFFFIVGRVVEHYYYLDSITRAILLSILILSYIFALINSINKLRKRKQQHSAIDYIEKKSNDKNQLLRTAQQLEDQPNHSSLEKEVLNSANNFMQQKQKRLTPEPPRYGMLIGAIVVMLIFIALAPLQRVWIKRLFNPMSNTSYTQLKIKVQKEFYQDENVPVKIFQDGHRKDKVTLHYKFSNKEWHSKEIRINQNSRKTFIFKNCKQSLRVYATADNCTTKTHFVSVVAPPKIEAMTATILHPNYMQKPNDIQKGGSIRCYEGDSIQIKVDMTQRMKEATLTLPDKRKIWFNIKDQIMKVHFMVSDTCSGNYFITGKDERGMVLRRQLFPIKAVADKIPTVMLIDPNKDIEVTETTELPIKILAHDDLGLKQIGITAIVNNQQIELGSFDATDSLIVRETLIAKLLLEDYQLDVKSNIRLFGWATDRKPNRDKKAVTELRGIDIRPYRLLYKVRPKEGQSKQKKSKPSNKLIVKLNQLIQEQRNINTGLFQQWQQETSDVSRQNLKKKCHKIIEHTDIVKEKINPGSQNLINEAKTEQQQTCRELEADSWQTAFNHSDKALSVLLQLKEEFEIELKRGKSSDCSCESTCSSLTQLAIDVDRLIVLQKTALANHQKFLQTNDLNIESKTITQQEQIYNKALELDARLQIHPDKTEQKLEQMFKVSQLMDESISLLNNRDDAQANMLQTINQLKQLATLLRGESPKQNIDIKKAQNMAQKVASLLKKQAKKHTKIGRPDTNESKKESKSTPKSSSSSSKKGKKTSSKSDKESKTSKDKEMEQATKDAKAIADWLNSKQQTKENNGLNSMKKKLAEEMKLEQLSKQMGNQKNSAAQLTQMAKQFEKLAQKLGQINNSMNSSKLNQVGQMHRAASKLLNSKMSEEEFNKQLEQLSDMLNMSKDEELQQFARQLKQGGGTNQNSSLRALHSVLTQKLNELLQFSTLSEHDVEVPAEYSKLVEQYFRLLSDDLELEEPTNNDN